MYNIKMLCQKANISQQTFYRLIKENREFGEIAEKGREKRGNSFRYPENVLNWLLEYYSIHQEDKPDDNTEQDDRPAEPNQDYLKLKEDFEREKSILIDKISTLENERDALETKLEEKEQERKALLLQNGQLLFLLAQEKQEKQALLPSPKKPFMERIKGIFKKEQP